MKLNNQEALNKIENCPLESDRENKILFRWTKSDLSLSYIPLAVEGKCSDKTKRLCEAWGLSMFDSLKAAKEALNGLSVKRRRKFTDITFSEISLNDGIKYQTGDNVCHYTFFPIENLDLINKFEVVNEE